MKIQIFISILLILGPITVLLTYMLSGGSNIKIIWLSVLSVLGIIYFGILSLNLLTN